MGKLTIKEKTVKYQVKYIGKETADLTPGKIYNCIAECYWNNDLHDLRIIDESEEDYLYTPEDFKKVEL